MRILAIESSCDDTSVALTDAGERGFVVIKMKTISQIDVHRQYGGVVPEVAGRIHAESIIPLIEDILMDYEKPDYIAVTYTPGLLTGLLVGVEAAKMLSWLMDIPLIGINHIEGHIYSTLLPASDGDTRSITFPALALIVSGGHTEIIHMVDHGRYELIGKTRDDAAGECFDKVGKLIGEGYPGGPRISNLAENGDRRAISFPRPMVDASNYDFSFAGLKTAALYWLKDNAEVSAGGGVYQLDASTLQDFCASIEEAIVDTLIQKTARAVREYQPRTLLLAGGVAANRELRSRLQAIAPENNVVFLAPPPAYTTDNAAMIARAAHQKALHGDTVDWKNLTASPTGTIYPHEA